MIRTVYKFLASIKLAFALLVIILVCCLVGVTVVRGARAGELIFGTLWFNSILVLLVVNVAFCFFGRIWGKRITLVSLGMILFHLSFVAMLGGIVYNSLFSFRGTIRLTEGETLQSGDPESFDYEEHGRFFDFSNLKGETTLVKVHRGFAVEGEDKQVAYEVEVGEGRARRRGIVYITQKLVHRGFEYIADREGYSILLTVQDRSGREFYGGHIPLQSFKQKDDKYLYATGTKEGPGSFPFPAHPAEPLFLLQAAYKPSFLKERAGETTLQVSPLDAGTHDLQKPAAEGKVLIGGTAKVGDYYLSFQEVRYWVIMTVRRDPGKPVVLASLWVALGGMIITFIGRIRKSRIEAKV